MPNYKTLFLLAYFCMAFLGLGLSQETSIGLVPAKLNNSDDLEFARMLGKLLQQQPGLQIRTFEEIRTNYTGNDIEKKRIKIVQEYDLNYLFVVSENGTSNLSKASRSSSGEAFLEDVGAFDLPADASIKAAEEKAGDLILNKLFPKLSQVEGFEATEQHKERIRKNSFPSLRVLVEHAGAKLQDAIFEIGSETIRAKPTLKQDGQADFYGIPNGRYTLSITKDNFLTIDTTVYVDQNSPIEDRIHSYEMENIPREVRERLNAWRLPLQRFDKCNCSPFENKTYYRIMRISGGVFILSLPASYLATTGTKNARSDYLENGFRRDDFITWKNRRDTEKIVKIISIATGAIFGSMYIINGISASNQNSRISYSLDMSPAIDGRMTAGFRLNYNLQKANQ